MGLKPVEAVAVVIYGVGAAAGSAYAIAVAPSKFKVAMAPLRCKSRHKFAIDSRRVRIGCQMDQVAGYPQYAHELM